MFTLHKQGRLTYLQLVWPGAVAVFTARGGGVSQGPYSSLNLGLNVEDDAEAVIANRERAAAIIGKPLSQFTACRQVHGKEVAVVGGRQLGCGVYDLETALPGCDGLLTQEPGALFAFFADCVPIWLYDPVQKAGGVIHAGWRGTMAGIVPEAVRKLKRRFGSEPADLYAAVGPSIGPCCYQVGEDVVRAAEKLARTKGLQAASFFPQQEPGKWRADLPGFNRALLLSEGLKPERISSSGLCSSCHSSLFFSHRRDAGKTGRMAAIFCLTGR